MKRFFFWIDNARYLSLPQSMLPTVVAVCQASTHGSFHFWRAAAAGVGVVCAHLAFNLLDDYFDYKKGSHALRERLAAGGFRARLGKCDYLTRGAATPRELLRAASLFLAAALCMALLLYLQGGRCILSFMFAGGLLGFFYSAPPFRLGYHGLGLPALVLLFGPLLMGGVMYASCGALDFPLLYLSLPVGILVANIAYTHDVMDVEPDKRSGKKTLAVLLGGYRGVYFASALFNFIPWILVIAGVGVGILNRWYLATLLLLPLSLHLFALLLRFRKDPFQEITPRWWMQPMERWREIRAGGIDWFMIRWYLARNILTYFCLLSIVLILTTS